MNLFGDKEKVRSVYGFEQGEAFETFYKGLVCLGNGDTVGAVEELSKLADGILLYEPAVYKFFIVAMLENGKSPEELIGYARQWEASAQAFKSTRDIRDATIARELFEEIAKTGESDDNKT
jgi:hypothetical protein